MQINNQAETPWHYDRWFLISALALLMIGLLMVSSASMVISDRIYGYPFHYIVRQSIFTVLGLFLAWLVTRVPIDLWQRYSGYLLLLSLLFLLLVLIPGIGRVVNGSRRWIGLGGISLQVSELAKLCVIVYLASYIQRFQAQLTTSIFAFIKPIFILAIFAILLLLEPDFGATAVISATVLALLFMSGVRLWPFLLLFLLVTLALAGLAVFSPYRLERLTTFLNPWHTQFGAGYQLTQSLIAFGRGGIFGVGLGNSVQKLFYLPEAHTDFLFAVLAEELGLLGELVVITLFSILVARAMWIARLAHKAGQIFPAFVTYGLGLWLGIQTFINIGVNIGLLPTKGLTLPLMSYGGSSMLINCIVIGMLLRISFEMKGELSSTVPKRRVYKIVQS